MTTIASCTGCGHAPDTGDRFCAECGLRLTVPSDAVGACDDGGFETGPDSESVVPVRSVSAESTRAESSGRYRHLLAVLAVAVVAVLGWRIFQPPRQDLGDIATALGAVRAATPADWGDRPADEPLVAIDLNEIRVESSAGRGQAAGSEPTEVELPAVTDDVLRELADQWLVVSNSTHLLRMDPATGAVDAFEPGGLVIGSHRDQLLISPSRSDFAVAPISNPAASRTVIDAATGQARGQVADVDLSDDGKLLVRYWGLEGPAAPANGIRLVTVDLDSGMTTERQTSADDWSGAWNGLGYRPGYGTFDVDPDGSPRWLSDGYVLAAGRRYAILLSCESPDDCERFWLDRETGDRIEREIPPDVDQFGLTDVFGPDDRFVTLYTNPGRAYFDSISGKSFVGPDILSGGRPFNMATEAATSDGRLVLVPTRDGVMIHDFRTGVSGQLSVDIPGSPVTVVLVPKEVDR